MSAVLHMPLVNTAPFMLKDKIGESFAPAFTAVNGRPSPTSPNTSTTSHSMPAWSSVSRDPASRPASHSISPTITNGDQSPDSPSKRKRSHSLEPDHARASSRDWGALPRTSLTASYHDQKQPAEPHQRTLPPIDRPDLERRWTSDPNGYEAQHRDSHTLEPMQNNQPPSSTKTEPSVYEEGVTELTRAGVQVEMKKRKRQFANRTKTGCGTCRRRKKKCDEAKPECNNCTRGGFLCEGYASKIPWPKNGAAKPPPPLQAKERMSSADIPPQYARCTVCNVVHIPHCDQGQKTHTEPTAPSANDGRPSSVEEHDRKPTAPSNWGNSWNGPPRFSSEHPPPPPPPRQSNPRVYHHTPQSMGQGAPNPPAVAPPAQYTQPPPALSHERPPHEQHASHPPPLPPPPSMAPLTIAPAGPPPPRYMHPSIPPKSEKDKMLSGEPFLPFTEQLVDERMQCTGAVYRFNSTSNAAVSIAQSERERFFKWIVAAGWIQPPRNGERPVNGHLGGGVHVSTPFHCDYGYNISVGENVVIGPSCQLLDSGRIAIGRNTKIGARVTITTLVAPVDTKSLKGSNGTEVAREVYIGENVYVGDGCIIEAGVRIGNGAILRAGSVVVRDIPPDCVAHGNPAEVRQVNWKD